MYGNFINNGREYAVTTPKTPREWKNKLFNDNYQLELTQTMQGISQTFLDYVPEAVSRSARYFYIADESTKEIFCPLYTPLLTPYKKFESVYSLGKQTVNTEFENIKTSVRAFVPKKGLKEIWTAEIENISEKRLNLSLYTMFDFGNNGTTYQDFDEKGNYVFNYCFPYHIFYDDKKKLEKNLKCIYMYSDVKCENADMSRYEFFGCDDDRGVPLAVTAGKCSGIPAQGENSPIGAMKHSITLKSGEKKTVNFIFGTCLERENVLREVELNVNDELEQVERMWNERCEKFTFETGNKELDYLANYWIKKQNTFLARENRFYFSSPARNQLQDAMGYAFCEPEEALKIAKSVMEKQEYNGFLRQWRNHNQGPTTGLGLLRHSDAPVWLAICFTEIISNILKDESRYNDLVKYGDCDKQETVYEHLVRALMFMTDKEQLGKHGLCLMRDGDWTDPMNASGRKGKGESVWNSMATVYAINELGKVKPQTELAKRAELLKENINKYAWDGKWYVASLDDDGRKLGTDEDEEGKLFLNTQTWAIISGVAEENRLEKVQKAIESLKTDFGYILLTPAFSKWNEKWGKISVKHTGTTENGSAYCHGTMFKGLADYVLGNYNDVMETILSVLPTNEKNPPEKNKQLPLYVPNYYFGLKNKNYGRSSCAYGTGTSSWILTLLNKISCTK